jgi:hypothetical protein
MKKCVWVFAGAVGLLFLGLLSIILFAAAYDYNKLKPLLLSARPRPRPLIHRPAGPPEATGWAR